MMVTAVSIIMIILIITTQATTAWVVLESAAPPFPDSDGGILIIKSITRNNCGPLAIFAIDNYFSQEPSNSRADVSEHCTITGLVNHLLIGQLDLESARPTSSI